MAQMCEGLSALILSCPLAWLAKSFDHLPVVIQSVSSNQFNPDHHLLAKNRPGKTLTIIHWKYLDNFELNDSLCLCGFRWGAYQVGDCLISWLFHDWQTAQSEDQKT